MSLLSTPALPLSELDGRAREIFRRVVESYLETGEPVGSRTLSEAGGLKLSPASIRNTMQDLTQLGLLGAPHTSAGRVPTHAGLRLFVDGLLEVGDLGDAERHAIESRLYAKSRSVEDALNEASAILSGLAGGAGVVMAPARDGGVKHVEFVSLSADQTLAVMVFEDGSVENRIMRHAPGLTPSALAEAGNFMNARLRGRTLTEAGAEVRIELESARRELDQAAARLVESGLAAWSGGPQDDRALIVRGRANLIDNAAESQEIDRIRVLFDDLERKRDIADFLELAETGEGVRIFIGSENKLFSLSGSSLVVSPYMNADRKIIGAVGVIGPTRLNYGRIVPIVDYTAQLVGRLMSERGSG